MIGALLALAVAFNVADTTVSLPTIVTALAPFIGAGGIVLLYTARVEKRLKQAAVGKSEAETEEIFQRVAEKAGLQIERLEARLNEARAELDATQAKYNADLAARDAKHVADLAQRDMLIRQLTERVRSLEIELETTRAQAGIIERREE